MSAEKGSDRRGSLGFEKQLWEAADLLLGNMEPSEYKHVVLGLLFLKYISDAFQERWDELARLVADSESDYYVDEAEREEELAALREERDEYMLAHVFWVHRWQRDGRSFLGPVHVAQTKLSIGEQVEELELIAKAAEPEELRGRITYLPLR